MLGVHWFNAARDDLPHQGWNVETVIGVQRDDVDCVPGSEDAFHLDGENGVQAAYDRCRAARDYGLTNIVRLDWRHMRAAPIDPANYACWIENFNRAVHHFYRGDDPAESVASIFIVGNEPTNEGEIPETPEKSGMPSERYAAAFNALYAQKVPGVMYLAACPAVWSFFSAELDIPYFHNLANTIHDLDGFAIHAYGSEPCRGLDGVADPRQPCAPFTGGDGGFRRYRDYLDQIPARHHGKPIFITEFNTQGQGSGRPRDNYEAGFIQKAREEIESYNSEGHPFEISALCWFVDDGRGVWDTHALSNDQPGTPLATARADYIQAAMI